MPATQSVIPVLYDANKPGEWAGKGVRRRILRVCVELGRVLTGRTWRRHRDARPAWEMFSEIDLNTSSLKCAFDAQDCSSPRCFQPCIAAPNVGACTSTAASSLLLNSQGGF